MGSVVGGTCVRVPVSNAAVAVVVIHCRARSSSFEVWRRGQPLPSSKLVGRRARAPKRRDARRVATWSAFLFSSSRSHSLGELSRRLGQIDAPPAPSALPLVTRSRLASPSQFSSTLPPLARPLTPTTSPMRSVRLPTLRSVYASPTSPSKRQSSPLRQSTSTFTYEWRAGDAIRFASTSVGTSMEMEGVESARNGLPNEKRGGEAHAEWQVGDAIAFASTAPTKAAGGFEGKRESQASSFQSTRGNG